MSLFCYALLCAHSSFAIILKRKRKLVSLIILSYRCIVTINVLWLYVTVPWVGLQYVIVVFPDHTHFLANNDKMREIKKTLHDSIRIAEYVNGVTEMLAKSTTT